MKKKWYVSKTLWVNVISIIALIVNGITNAVTIDAETSATLLAVANIILRLVTREEIVWKDEKGE